MDIAASNRFQIECKVLFEKENGHVSCKYHMSMGNATQIVFK